MFAHVPVDIGSLSCQIRAYGCFYQAAAADTIESSPNGRGVTALAHASMVDEMTHVQRVVKRDRRGFSGFLGRPRVASGDSAVTLSLEPPALSEFEPGHLVADTE